MTISLKFWIYQSEKYAITEYLTPTLFIHHITNPAAFWHNQSGWIGL